MNWQLFLVGDGSEPRDLTQGFSIGRSERCHWPIEDDSMSRVHASFDEVGGRFFVKDSHSSNGVYLNGERVREVEIFPGDRLQIGEKVFQVSGGAETVIKIVEEDGPLIEARLPDKGWTSAGWRTLSHQLLDTLSFLKASTSMIVINEVKEQRFNEVISKKPVDISSWIFDEISKGPFLLNSQEAIDGRQTLILRRVSSLMAIPLGRGAFCYLESSQGIWGEKELAQVREIIAEFLVVFRPSLESWASREALVAISSQDKNFNKQLQQLRKAAKQDVNVLIEGPAGTGKSLLAKWLHEWSPRNDENRVCIDLSLIPEELVASSLLGYEKGAFTGAEQQRDGYLFQAHRGTLVLENFDESSDKIQTQLLKVLEDKEYSRVGGTEKLPLDLRLVVTSRRSLNQMVKEKSFREDLFYRLAVFSMTLPSLDERGADIESLSGTLLSELAKAQGRKKVSLEKNFLKQLQARLWPGNVRELKNLLERALVENPEDEILKAQEEKGVDSFLSLKDLERAHILKALNRCQWNKGETCEMLGVTRPTLAKKITDYNLHKEN